MFTYLTVWHGDCLNTKASYDPTSSLKYCHNFVYKTIMKVFHKGIHVLYGYSLICVLNKDKTKPVSNLVLKANPLPLSARF